MNGERFMHHDARGECGPYTATHAEGPWYCMVPDGVEVPPDSPVLQSGGLVGLNDYMRARLALGRQVGWASNRSLLVGRDNRGIGWERM